MTLNLEKLKCEKYEHIISLGSFCSPALELERFGFRDASYPFDWVLSHTFKSVLELINNSFKGFLNSDQLYQRRDARQIYENILFDIIFVHDFSKHRSFHEQYKNIEKKYQRRIDRFYGSIIQPTLFIRYIETTKELCWICRNQIDIVHCLKTYNDKNEILYIVNSETIKKHMILDMPVLIVTKDENDTVARKFLDQGDEIVEFLATHYNGEKRKKNLEYFSKKHDSIDWLRLVKKIIISMKPKYIHDKVI